MLEIKDISKKYTLKKDLHVQALDKVSLSFGDKGLVFLLGKSGSGKSTLLNILGGLDLPDSGEIILNNRSFNKFSKSDYDSYRNTYVGFIFQEYNVLDEFTVEQNISIALELQGKSNDKKAIQDILNKVELNGFEKRKPDTLSGGQKQRVAIARALIKNPQIILADEPTGALDSETGKQVLDLLKKLSKDKLVIVVSHDREFAQKYADRIVELKDGKILSDSQNNNSTKENNACESNCADLQDNGLLNPKLPVKYAVKLGTAGIRKKPFRFAFTLFLTLLSLIMFGIFSCLMFFDSEAVLYKSFEDSHQEVFAVKKSYERTTTEYSKDKINKESSITHYTYLDSKDIQILQKNKNTIGVYSTLINCDKIINLNLQDKLFYDNSIKGVIASDNLQFILGHAPENKNEIAVSEFTWESIKNGKLTDENGNLIQVKDTLDGVVLQLSESDYYNVCGVFKCQSIPQKYENLKNSDDTYLNETWLLNITQGTTFYNYIAIHESAYDIFVPTDLHTIQNYELGNRFILSYRGSELLFDREVITLNSDKQYYDNKGNYTRYTNSKNAMVLPCNMYADMLDKYINIVSNQAMPDEFYYQKSEIQNLLAKVIKRDCNKEEKLEYLKSATQFIDKYTTFDYKLTMGIGAYSQSISVLGYSLYDRAISMSEDLKEIYKTQTLDQGGTYEVIQSDYHSEVTDEVVFEQAILLTKDYSMNDYKAMLNTASTDIGAKYEFYNDLYRYITGLTKMFSLASNVFLGLGIAFMVFAILLLFNFISTSIERKKRQLGILRALGGGKKEMLKVYIFEPLVLILISCIVAIVITGILATVINNNLMYSEDMQISMFVYDWKSVLSIVAVSLVVCIVSAILPVYKATRQTPVECIRNA